MYLDRGKRDLIILGLARGTFDSPDIAFRRWQQDRRPSSWQKHNTGRAQTSGFGPDAFELLDQAVEVAWASAVHWCELNNDQMQIGLPEVSALTDYVRQSAMAFLAHGKEFATGVSENFVSSPLIDWIISTIRFLTPDKDFAKGVAENIVAAPIICWLSKMRPLGRAKPEPSHVFSSGPFSGEEVSRLSQEIADKIIEHLVESCRKTA